MYPQKLYDHNDMVKVGCHDCSGCSDCCQDMGQSIWLDPYDIYQLTINTGKSFESLLAKEIELHVEDGLILPNIKMAGEGIPKCSFLNEERRCSIHSYRPGFCRLFPLGRNYEDGRLTYFLLDGACPTPNKSKMKVNKAINMQFLQIFYLIPYAAQEEFYSQFEQRMDRMTEFLGTLGISSNYVWKEWYNGQNVIYHHSEDV